MKKTGKKKASTRRAPARKKGVRLDDLPEPKGEAEPDGTEEQIRILSKGRILPYLASLMLLAATFFVFIVYRSYAWAAFIAMLLYVAFDGLNRRLLRPLGKNRSAAAGMTTLIVVVAVLGPIAFLARHMLQELYGLVRASQQYIAGDRILETAVSFPLLTDNFTEEPFFWTTLPETYRSYLLDYGAFLESARLSDWLSNAYSVVTGGISLTAGLVVNLFFGLIILFFLFRDGPLFYSFLREALPFPGAVTESFVRRMRQLIRAVLLGNLLVSILQGAAVGIGLWICGINNSVVYGVTAGLFSLIPIIGTAVVWLPAALYLAFFEGSYGYAIFLAAWGALFYLFLENILKPKILDKRLGMHPMFLFLAILGGIAEFGPTGVILGPLIVTLFMTIWSIYHIWGGAESAEAMVWPGAKKSAVSLEPVVPTSESARPEGGRGRVLP